MAASLYSKVLLPIRSTCFQQIRFRGKINIQRPRKPDYNRARLIAVTNPIYPEKDLKEKCKTITTHKEKVENPYEKLIAKEVFNWLDKSKITVIYHLNSITQEELFKIRVPLHKHNVHVKAYGKNVMKLAVKDTKYEAILPLFESKNCILFSQDNKIKEILRITKKVPQMILLAGIIENRLLSKSEINFYSTMPNLQATQSQLISTLNTGVGKVLSQLECHQKTLITILDTYVKLDSEKKDKCS